MMHQPLHRVPPLRVVFIEQVRTAGLALRTPAIVVTVLLALLALRELSTGQPSAGFHPELSMMPGMVGFFIPFVLWKGDEHAQNGYFWALPIDRTTHALTRLAAGWTWLIAFVTVVFVLELTLYVTGGGRLNAEETLRVLPAAASQVVGRVDPASLQTIRWTPRPFLWLVPFSAATGVYALASALAVATRRPLRWAIAPLVALGSIFVLGDIGRVPWMERTPQHILQPLLFGRYGLDALLTARTEFLHTEVTLTTGEVAPVWQALPDLAAWATATVLWTAAGMAGLLLATYRLRERRRPARPQ